MWHWEAERCAAAVAARPSVETAAKALQPPALFKFGSQLAARGGGHGGFYFLSLRADSPAAQPWPRDGSGLVGRFVCEGFFPLQQALHCVPAALGGGRTGCHGGRRERAGGDGRTDGLGGSAARRCSESSLEESSGRGAEMELPPCFLPQLQFERGEPRRM